VSKKKEVKERRKRKEKKRERKGLCALSIASISGRILSF
jgi:hypothetical protein